MSNTGKSIDMSNLLSSAVTGNYSPKPKNKIRRFAEWLYRLTVEVGENHFDMVGTYADEER